MKLKQIYSIYVFGRGISRFKRYQISESIGELTALSVTLSGCVHKTDKMVSMTIGTHKVRGRFATKKIATTPKLLLIASLALPSSFEFKGIK